jgi:hypothetical protein
VQPLKIALQFRVVRINRRDERIDKRPGAALRRQAVEHPGAFGEPLYQSCAREEFEVARKSWLALVQYLCKFAYGQLAMRQQGENPRTGYLAGGAELGDEAR